MLTTKITIFLFIIYNFGNAKRLKSCSDCMETSSCPDVDNWPENGLHEKVSKSLCGRKKKDDGNYSIMICCSDFLPAPRPLPDVFSRLNDGVETQNDIDNHPNIELLPENCGKHFGDRIVGGNYANLYEFPWMALIAHVEKDPNGIRKRKFGCGGSIISSRHILTAAHCVKDKHIAGIRLGEYNINKRRDCQGSWPNNVCEEHLQDVRVEKEIIHEEYSIYQKGRNDIAILRVNKDIDFMKNVKPICLPVTAELRNLNLSGRSATVAGWGVTETGKPSSILRKVTVPIMAETNCTKLFESYPSQQYQTFKNFCAGEIGKDSCNGDSGGPLVLDEDYKDNMRMIQYGIVSFGPVLCGSEMPGVYTDVSKYMKWILDNLK